MNEIKSNYIYLLHEREFIRTKENIYKVGMSRQSNLSRFNNYPKGSQLICQIECIDCKFVETVILRLFSDKFHKCNEYGNEYFQGDKKCMIDIIYIIISFENEIQQQNITHRSEYIESILANHVKKYNLLNNKTEHSIIETQNTKTKTKMKTCNGTKTEEPQITNPTDSNVMNIMNMLLQDNVAFKKIIADVVKNTTEIIKTNQDLMANQQSTTDKVLELCLNNTNNATSVTNNNIYNHNGDNHFSINVFLNEKCKDAMNMSDFVNSIELSREDMENVGRNGYVKGISNIFIDNLKNTDVHKRPIHCSDRKREVLYVKEHDKWEREGVNSDNLIKAVKTVEHKNITILNEWAKQHPECEKSETRANDMYMKLSKHGYDGEDENILKVVKNIAKETVIERNNFVE